MFRGIDLRETGDRLLIRAMLEDSAGDPLATGTTVLRLYEFQADGTLNSYDFADNTFKAGALTTETLALGHQKGNNGTVDTGIWTVVLETLTGFTAGNLYVARITNTAAFPATQSREFQFGAGSSALDPYDGVRAGLTALHNAAAGTGSGLPSVQDVAKITHHAEGSIHFVAPVEQGGDDDDNDGLSPGAPKLSPRTVTEAATAGDVVVLGIGTFALGGDGIAVPASVALKGAGMGLTRITSTREIYEETGGAIVKPGTQSLIEDLTIEGVAVGGTGVFQAPIGIDMLGDDAPFTDALVRRVETIGDTDGAFMHLADDASCSMYLEDCVLRSKYDCYSLFKYSEDVGAEGGYMRLTRCALLGRGPSLTNSRKVRGGQCRCGRVDLFDCNTQAVGGTLETSAHRVYLAGEINIHGGTSLVNGIYGYEYSLSQEDSGVIRVFGHDYDHTKTNGSITVVSSAKSAAEIYDAPTYTEMVNALAGGVALTAGERSTLAAAIEAALVNDGDATALLQAIADKFAAEFDIEDLTLAAVAAAVRDAILNRVLAGNHDTAGTVGKVLQTVAGDVAGLDGASIPTDYAKGQDIADLQTHGDSEWATGESAGTGARKVIVTVNDGTTVLESARVRFIKGGEERLGTTNESGVKEFGLNDGTWDVIITLANHSFTPTTLVVDGNKTKIYSMTPLSVTPSDAPFVDGMVTCYVDGVPTAGVQVDLVLVKHVTSGVMPVMPAAGYWSATSGADGVAVFSNVLLPGASYKLRNGDGEWSSFTVPATQATAYAIPRAIGVETS